MVNLRSPEELESREARVRGARERPIKRDAAAAIFGLHYIARATGRVRTIFCTGRGRARNQFGGARRGRSIEGARVYGLAEAEIQSRARHLIATAARTFGRTGRPCQDDELSLENYRSLKIPTLATRPVVSTSFSFVPARARVFDGGHIIAQSFRGKLESAKRKGRRLGGGAREGPPQLLAERRARAQILLT